MISSRFVWCSLSSNVATWARSCLHCQQSKTHRHARLLPQHIATPQLWFADLHSDLLGPLHYSNNCDYVFTVIDGTSKRMEAVPSGMHTRVNIFLDILRNYAWNDHFWLWAAIFFKCLVSALHDDKHHALPNDRLSSWGKWRSRKTPPLPQGCASCSLCRGNLCCRVTLGTPRTLRAAKGRHWYFSGWGSSWNSNCFAKWVFTWRRIFCWQYLKKIIINFRCSCFFSLKQI